MQHDHSFVLERELVICRRVMYFALHIVVSKHFQLRVEEPRGPIIVIELNIANLLCFLREDKCVPTLQPS